MAYRSLQDSVNISESLAALSDTAERLYWRMLSQTDSWGRLAASRKKLRAQCYSLISWSDDEVAVALIELGLARRVQLYVHEGELYAYLLDFDDNQAPDLIRKRGKSRLPEPPPYEKFRPRPEYSALLRKEWQLSDDFQDNSALGQSRAEQGAHSRESKEKDPREVLGNSNVVVEEKLRASNECDDDDLNDFKLGKKQRGRILAYQTNEPERFRACVRVARAKGEKKEALLDDLLERGEWPEREREMVTPPYHKPFEPEDDEFTPEQIAENKRRLREMAQRLARGDYGVDVEPPIDEEPEFE